MNLADKEYTSTGATYIKLAEAARGVDKPRRLPRAANFKGAATRPAVIDDFAPRPSSQVYRSFQMFIVRRHIYMIVYMRTAAYMYIKLYITHTDRHRQTDKQRNLVMTKYNCFTENCYWGQSITACEK